MITNEKQLQMTKKRLTLLEESVAALRERYAKTNPERFLLMAEQFVVDIHTLRAEIDEYIGIKIADVERSAVWIRIAGPVIIGGSIPVKLLNTFMEKLQTSLVYMTKSIVRAKKIPVQLQDVRKECNILLMGTAPGSFEVGLDLEPPTEQLYLLPKETVPQMAFSNILEIASKITLREPEDLRRLVPDVRTRRLILRSLQDLTPAKASGVDVVEFRPRKKRPLDVIRFDLNTRKYISELITEEEKHLRSERGEIRELNLDSRSFQIRSKDQKKKIKCAYSEDMEDLVMSSLKKVVKVTGKATLEPETEIVKSIDEVIDIEIVSE